jgi:cytochrome P450
MLVYWQILYILSTPGLVARIRAEIAPYAVISKPISIGTISEAPKLSIDHEGLAKNCPLLNATYFEALRLTDQPWSVRYAATNVSIQGDKKNIANHASFLLKKGDYVTVPHDLHMRDATYFPNPEKFDPERFLERGEDGVLRVDPGSIRPYGGGPSMCKGRLFAERECLALVAGVLAFWDIGPVNKKIGWVIPKQEKASAVSRPVGDTRVLIRRRSFEWEK